MVFIPVPNVAAVHLRYTQSGQLTENVLHFEGVAPVTAVALNILAEDIFDWWNANLKPLINAQTFLREVYAVSLDSATSPTGTFAPSSPVAGTYTGTPLPNNATIAVSFRTEGRGRSSRGRVYQVGLSETSLSSTQGQSVQAVYASDLVDAYDLLRISPPSTWTFVVVSRYTGGAPRITGLAQPVTQVVLTDTFIDSQRRRLPTRGT